MGASKGCRVAELMTYGATLLTTNDVLPRVVRLIPILQVQGMFPDGMKMISVPPKPLKSLSTVNSRRVSPPRRWYLRKAISCADYLSKG